MSEREKGFDWKLDGAGLAAFGTGAFLSVLAVLALTREAPLDDPLAVGGTTTLAALWTGTLGALPCLLLGVVLTVLGARTFLLGEARGALKGIAIAAGVAFGLAIVLGSLGLDAAWADGGIAGEALGGTLARRAHPAAGVLLGLVVLAAVAWFATLRERVLAREAREAAAAPLRHAPVKAAPAAQVAVEANEGVTAEEAAALVPDEGHRRAALAAALALAREQGALDDLDQSDEPPPPFPYPEDVRLKGEIPLGARPLGEPQRPYPSREPVREPMREPMREPVREPVREPAQASGVVRWTPDRGDDADVFAEEPSATALAEPEQDLEAAFESSWSARDMDEPLELDALVSEPHEVEAEADEEEGDEPELDVELAPLAERDAEPSEVAAVLSAVPPRPSWEQNSLFHEEEDEPVDAYGTPIALVETLTADEPVDVAQELDAAADLDEDDDGDLEDEDELDEDEADGELDEEDEEDEEELDEAASLDEDEEEDAQGEEEDEDEEEDLDEAAELDEDGEASAEDDDEELDDAAELEDETLAEGDGSVLIPQPTPASEHAKRAALPDGSKQRIYEAGCLFLDRGRVAVSMLQREYGLEFDDACTMLDELQDMGLIGPYLGGKHRDILLSSDEWLERVSAS